MEQETKVKIVKGTAFASKAVIGSVSAACASYVLKNVIEELMPAPVTLPAKIATKVGIAVIGGAAAAMANATVDSVIDATAGAATMCLGIEEIANADCTADGTDVVEYDEAANQLLDIWGPDVVDYDTTANKLLELLKVDCNGEYEEKEVEEDAGDIQSCIA